MKVPFAYRLMNCVEEKWRSYFKNEQTTSKKQEFPMFPLNFRKYLKTVQLKNCNSHITCLLQPFPQNNFPHKMSISCYCYCLKMTPIMAVSRTTGTPRTSCWDVPCCISDIHGQYVDDKTLGMRDKTHSCHWIWKFELKCLVSPFTNKVAGCI